MPWCWTTTGVTHEDLVAYLLKGAMDTALPLASRRHKAANASRIISQMEGMALRQRLEDVVCDRL